MNETLKMGGTGAHFYGKFASFASGLVCLTGSGIKNIYASLVLEVLIKGNVALFDHLTTVGLPIFYLTVLVKAHDWSVTSLHILV